MTNHSKEEEQDRAYNTQLEADNAEQGKLAAQPESSPRKAVWSPAGAFIALLGSGAIVLGSFLAWATGVSEAGTLVVNGMQGDGGITLALGLVAGLIAMLAVAKTDVAGWRLIVLVAGVIAGIIGVISAYNVSRAAGGVSSFLVYADVGPGLYAIIVGGVLVVVGTLGAVRQDHRPARSEMPARGRANVKWVVAAAIVAVVLGLAVWGLSRPMQSINANDRHVLHVTAIVDGIQSGGDVHPPTWKCPTNPDVHFEVTTEEGVLLGVQNDSSVSVEPFNRKNKLCRILVDIPVYTARFYFIKASGDVRTPPYAPVGWGPYSFENLQENGWVAGTVSSAGCCM